MSKINNSAYIYFKFLLGNLIFSKLIVYIYCTQRRKIGVNTVVNKVRKKVYLTHLCR